MHPLPHRSAPTLLLLAATLLLARPADAADPHAAAKSIYAASCAHCHGADLHGGGAASLADGVWVHGSRAIHRSIEFGVPEAGMPAFGETLSKKEVRQLVAYMKSVEKQAVPERPPLPDTVPTRDYDLKITPVAEGLTLPWAIALLNAPGTDAPLNALVTERGGRLRIIRSGTLDPRPIQDTPQVAVRGQGGLLDVATDPHYAENGWIYLSYAHAAPDWPEADGKPPLMTRVVRGKIEGHRWTQQQTVWEANPEHYLPTQSHFGSRFAFDPQGRLYFGIGDRGRQPLVQDLGRPNGKIHRVNPDGSIPADNPFVGRGNGVYESIFSYGHRNPQGLTTHPQTGDIWETEHGPLGGDELNVLRPGRNYGWPEISYGLNYNNTVLTGRTTAPDMEQPVLYWKPSIAACGLAAYRGSQFPRWQNNLFAGGLAYETLQRLVVVDHRVIYQEPILKNLGRVRDVKCGPDGALYVVLNDPGTVIRVSHLKTHPGTGDDNPANP